MTRGSKCMPHPEEAEGRLEGCASAETRVSVGPGGALCV